jgi:hypothetical protein
VTGVTLAARPPAGPSSEVTIDRIADVHGRGGAHVALATAIIAVIAWGVAAPGLGAWKTTTREI